MPAISLIEPAGGQSEEHMLNVGKSGNALSRYPEMHRKLCRGGDPLLAIALSSHRP